MRPISVALLCLTAVGGVSAQDPPEVTEFGFERGKLLYQSHCGRCHSFSGSFPSTHHRGPE